MRKPKIIVIGSLVYDLVAKAERRPQKGESLLGTEFGMFPGGKGANQAVQCAKLGAEVWMVGRVGDDFFGESLIKNLKKEGVNTKYIVKDKTTTTAVGCIVIDKEGDNSIVMVPQANMKNTKADVEKVKNILGKFDVLILQLEIPLNVVIYSAKLARKNNLKIILNPAPAKEIPDSLIKICDILTPNETEAEILTGIKIENLEDAKSAGKRLLTRGAKCVIITLGEKGALYCTKEEISLIPSFKVKAVDTTAAGDAFNGTLAVAIALGKEIKEGIKLANAAGALSATKMGAQPSLPGKKELEKFLGMKI
jgi:ribokinase